MESRNNLIDEKRIRGWWSIPGDPSDPIPGEFVYSPVQAGRLNLYSNFSVDEAEVIKGFSTENLPITLLNSFTVQAPIFGDGPSSFLVNAAVIGRHYEAHQDVFVDGFVVRFDLLNSWANLPGLTVELSQPGRPAHITCDRQSPIRIFENSEVRLSLGLSQHGPNCSFVQDQVNIRQNTYFVVEKKQEALSLDRVFQIVAVLQNFLTLMTSEPVRPLDLRTMRSTMEDEQFEILYRPLLRQKPTKDLLPPQMLCCFAKLNGIQPPILQRWFESQELLRSSYGEYFGVLYRDELPLDTKLLSFARALETFHRQTRNNQELSNEVFKNLISEISEASPEAHKDWIRSKLNSISNEPAFRTRIEGLCDEFRQVVSPYMPSLDTFPKRLVASRNHYTHPKQKANKDVQRGLALHRLNMQVKFLLEVCYLHHVGFSKNEIAELFKPNEYSLKQHLGSETTGCSRCSNTRKEQDNSENRSETGD